MTGRLPGSPFVPWIIAGCGSVLGTVLLHRLTVALWPERTSHGLLMWLEENPRNVPLLGHWEISLWGLILAAILLARLVERRPSVLTGLGASVPGHRTTGFLLLLGLYGSLGLVGLGLEHWLTFHFTTVIAHYLTTATVFAGLLFAGRRPPFRDLCLRHDPAPEARRTRRKWDLATATLLLVLYINWMRYEALSQLEYSLSGWQLVGMQLSTVPFGILLGWSLLKGSAISSGDRMLTWLERRARALDSTKHTASPFDRAPFEWLAHSVAMALWLLSARGLWVWSRDLWLAGRWIVPTQQPQSLFGVDWYWVSVWESVTAAEFVLFAGYPALTALCLFRCFRRSESAGRSIQSCR